MKIKAYLTIVALTLMLSCTNNQEKTEPGIHYFNDFASQYVASRNIEVLLPADYNPENSYDVLYMHDGQNVFNPQTSYTGTNWGVKEAMDSLLEAGTIRPAIVVAIWNTENRILEYMPNKPEERIQEFLAESPSYESVLSDEYLRFIVSELKPFIDSTFSTNRSRESTFVMGSSMGGLISLYAVLEYPQVFGGAGCLSTHWPIGEGVVLEYVEKNLPAAGSHRFYFDHGTINLDSLYAPYQQRADQMLLEKGYEHSVNWMTYIAEGADHNEAAWKERIHLPLEFLLGKEN